VRDSRVVAAGLAAGLALVLTGCTAGTGNDPPVPDEQALSRASKDALDLLESSPTHGYRAQPLVSGHDRTTDKGHEVSRKVKGRALFQIVCSGSGKISVTMPRQHVSKLVHCGGPAAGFPFRGALNALVVGQRDSTGTYAWRILPRA
jgi:hypothetical protein